MKICPNCNASLPDDSMFCVNCGSSVASVAPVPQQVPAAYGNPMPPAQPPKKKKTGLIVALIIVAVLILGGIGAGVAYFVLSADTTEPVLEEETEILEEITSEETEEETTTKKTEETSAEVTVDAIEQKIAAYVELYREEIIDGFNQGFGATSDITCTVTVEAERRGIVINCSIAEFVDLPDDVKNTLQSTYDGMESIFDSSLEMLRTELPEIEYLKMNICENDGDVVATILAQGESLVEDV